MFNKFKNIRIKKRDGFIASTAMVVSILAIFISLGSQTTECALADDTCTVSSTETFTGDVGIMSATNNTFLIQHALTNDVTANVQDSGGPHVGTLILKDNSNDFNLAGGLVLGTSSTSTNGTIRYDSGTDKIQYYSSTASAFTDVGGSSGGGYCGMTVYNDSSVSSVSSNTDLNFNTVASNSCTSVLENDTGSGHSRFTNKVGSGVTAMFQVQGVINAICQSGSGNPCKSKLYINHSGGKTTFTSFDHRSDTGSAYVPYYFSGTVCLVEGAYAKLTFEPNSTTWNFPDASDTDMRFMANIYQLGAVDSCDSFSGALP